MKVEIIDERHSESGKCSIMIDGKEIGDKTSYLNFELTPQGQTQVKVILIPDELVINLDDADVHMMH